MVFRNQYIKSFKLDIHFMSKNLKNNGIRISHFLIFLGLTNL